MSKLSTFILFLISGLATLSTTGAEKEILVHIYETGDNGVSADPTSWNAASTIEYVEEIYSPRDTNPFMNSGLRRNFGAKFQGHLNFPTSGTYELWWRGDDFANLYINGEERAQGTRKDNWNWNREYHYIDQPTTKFIEIYMHNGGLAADLLDKKSGIEFKWRTPGMNTWAESIPRTAWVTVSTLENVC